jgi:hypothetical protein
MNFKFIENHKDELIQLTITHRKQAGFGCLFLDLSGEEKVDVKFMPIMDETFPPQIKNTLLERREKNPESIAYFVCFTKDNTNIVEMDLNKQTF